ncbi:MAG: DUF3524 domain-containing protein [Marinobacterium sp.]|nr:DUF3524 domain-containing protein [Marinobacterium sp.]
MKILLLSAYDAASHRYWHRSLVAQFPEYQWTVLTLPGRFFAWRVRGNSLSWAFNERDTLSQRYDLVIATSMTDLSALRGFIPSLANTPTLVYFHENQFEYPRSGREHPGVEPQILNLYTALAADRVLFNSEFNRRTLIEGARKLLKKMPDQVPVGLPERLQACSQVLPVPLTADLYRPHLPRDSVANPDTHNKPLEICWNHRREFDKNGELLLAALQQLRLRTRHFRLHLAGQQFRHEPAVFSIIEQQFADQLGQCGYVESEEAYRALLQHSDVVLSTALHDFQGLAVLEGVAAGAIPVVPDRLAYIELFDDVFRYTAKTDEAGQLANHLYHLSELKAARQLPAAPDIQHLSWQQLRPAYQNVIEKTAAQPAFER